MAVGETPVTMVGTVLSDLVAKRVGEKRHEMVTFWLRSNERRYDKDNEKWVDGRHFSVRVKCWRRLAVAVQATLRKGDSVIVSGRLYSNDYDSEGQTRSVSEVEASAIGPNLATCGVVMQRGRRLDPEEGADPLAWQAGDASPERQENRLVEPASAV
jgi:single-strand DNA-binding protein